MTNEIKNLDKDIEILEKQLNILRARKRWGTEDDFLIRYLEKDPIFNILRKKILNIPLTRKESRKFATFLNPTAENKFFRLWQKIHLPSVKFAYKQQYQPKILKGIPFNHFICIMTQIIVDREEIYTLIQSGIKVGMNSFYIKSPDWKNIIHYYNESHNPKSQRMEEIHIDFAGDEPIAIYNNAIKDVRNNVIIKATNYNDIYIHFLVNGFGYINDDLRKYKFPIQRCFIKTHFKMDILENKHIQLILRDAPMISLKELEPCCKKSIYRIYNYNIKKIIL